MAKDRDDDLRDALRPRIHDLLTEMWTHEPGVRSFEDPENVHQMRVSSRRVRSALDAAGDLLDSKRDRAVRKRVRDLTRALGGVRDGDVLIMSLQHLRTDMDDGEHAGIDRLVDRIQGEQEQGRQRLLSTLNELDADSFREASLDVFPKGKKGKGKIRRRDARRMVHGHIEEFLAHAKALPPEENAEELHELRIVTKRLRYALQLFRQPLEPDSEGMITTLTEMQDQLGHIHDLDVLEGLVRNEMRAIADEVIDAGLSGDVSPSGKQCGAWKDLLALGRKVAEDRRHSYARLAGWWDDMEAGSFREDLRAIAG